MPQGALFELLIRPEMFDKFCLVGMLIFEKFCLVGMFICIICIFVSFINYWIFDGMLFRQIRFQR